MDEAQRRYQVFVSSTYLDLRDERQAVTAALLECEAFPAGMELFPAADDDAWTLITKVIDESDYYLLVIGGKYGSVDPEVQISYTEKEFDYAVAKKKPVMAFLHGEPGALLAKNVESKEELQEKLSAFRSKVESSKHVKYWTSPEGLAGQVALTFNRFVRLYPAVGWLRADQASSRESLAALAAANERIADLERDLSRTATTAPPGAEDLAQGDDVYRYLVNFSGRHPVPNSVWRDHVQWMTLEDTWNDLFTAVCPRLLDECDEETLGEALATHAQARHFDEIVKRTRAALAEKGLPDGTLDKMVNIETTIDDDDLGTIVLQFVALGLIARSEKRRSVADTATYWTLTPLGQTRAVQLRAVRRSPPGIKNGGRISSNDEDSDGQAP